MKPLLLLILLLSALACASGAAYRPHSDQTVLLHGDSAYPVDDHEIISYAHADFDRSKMMFTKVIIGKHDGALVVAEHPCADVCPDYTKRVVHYELASDQSCDDVGGVVRPIGIPYGIGISVVEYCIPPALAQTGTER